MDLEAIRRLLNRRLTDRTSSHYADCDGDHIDCAAHALLAEVERLRGELEQQRADIRRWAVRR